MDLAHALNARTNGAMQTRLHSTSRNASIVGRAYFRLYTHAQEQDARVLWTVAEWLSLASLLCSESMLRRCAKSTFETFELQRPMYVRCKPHVPLLNLNRTHAPSEGDGRTIHDNIYKYIYIQTAQVLIGLEGAR